MISAAAMAYGPRKLALRDIGTYLIAWCRDFADRHPETEIIGIVFLLVQYEVLLLIISTGTDLSPIQPDFTPPNLKFEIDDCCSAWVYPENHFDYIHIRMLVASVADWPALYRECYKYAASILFPLVSLSDTHNPSMQSFGSRRLP